MTAHHGHEIIPGLMTLICGSQVSKTARGVAVARFELGNDADQRDRRVLRQREASDIIDRLLKGVSLVR